MEELLGKLREIGFNRDVVVDEEVWREEKQELHRTRLSLASVEGKDETTFRDNRSIKSLELKDCSDLEDIDGDYIAELEKFNPEFHPVLHVLTDFPVWVWRNRIWNREPAEMYLGGKE